MNKKRALYFMVAVLAVLLISTISKDAASKKEGTPVEQDGGYSGGTFENGRTCISTDVIPVTQHTGIQSFPWI